MTQSNYGLRGLYRLHSYPGAQVDDLGANPLVEYAYWTDTDRTHRVAAVAEPPKMFSGGTSDVPAFTASGLPPDELLKLPFGMRHAVAAEPDITKVYAYFEGVEGLTSDSTIPHEGLENAYFRVQQWLENTDARTEVGKAQEAAEHDDMLATLGVDVARLRERQQATYTPGPRTGRPGSYGGPAHGVGADEPNPLASA